MKTVYFPLCQIRCWIAGFAGILMLSMPAAHAATWGSQLDIYVAQAGQPAEARRGQLFFTSTQGHEWSCASCHGQIPTASGKHASTGKSIAPLAPAFEPTRFTDAGKTEKWFRRNCKDVLGRECTPGEKADVLAFLGTLK